jgi:spermidine synthase
MTNLGGRRVNPIAEQLIMGSPGDHWRWLDAIEGNLFLSAVFVLNALMFIPLGHLAGRLMDRLPRLESYGLNLLGSLAGIGLFFLLSLLWTGPLVWLGLAALLVAPFLVGHRRAGAVAAASLAVLLMAAGLMGKTAEKHYFSPYQIIALRLPDETDAVPTPSIRVNHCFYQDILDCSSPALAASPKNGQAALYYDLPYRLQPEPGQVLVVGAGTGNDVAAALRHDALSVTAVEIDPAILYLGKKLHPERPYQDARTRPIVNDARTFLRQTDQRFDTIIYGLLDSHTNLGAMTNVRLDSFVYTVEGFRAAVNRLKDDGLLIVSYLVLDRTQSDKLYAMLERAYPQHPPRAFTAHYGGATFVTGPGLEHMPARFPGVEELTLRFQQSAQTADIVTDDWPFFYMKHRTYPVTYAIMVGILLLLSCFLVRRHRGGLHLGTSTTAAFFFLGAGFMLIETKSITELGLVFGNTWSVIAIAISGILLMVYGANCWVVCRGPVPHGRSFTFLGVALILGFGLARLGMAGVAIPFPKVVMTVVLTLPLFFAGLIFSSELAKRGEIGAALSANLFGAILGGFLEYNSMYWGFSSLYPLGMVLYGLAYYCIRRASRQALPLTEDANIGLRISKAA